MNVRHHRTDKQIPWALSQTGFNLIEVLVALLVLAVGLLGLAALQNFSFSATHQSFQRTQATMAIQNIADRIRANPIGALAGNYKVASYTRTLPTFTDCKTTPCSGADMANYDVAQWLSFLTSNAVLGASGQGQILVTGGVAGEYTLYEIGVQWIEGNVTMTQTMTVELP